MDDVTVKPDAIDAAPLGRPAIVAARLLAAVGVGALGLGFLWAGRDGQTASLAYHRYLVSYCFWLSIGLGSLFFVGVQHATRAGWSVCLRRTAEALAGGLWVLALLFLPILASVLSGSDRLYGWNDPALAGGLVAHKAPYLNAPFFALRAVAYWAVWCLLAWFFWHGSTRQDASGDPALTVRMERFSGPALVLFAVAITFAAFDWLMSLQPEWFSTIFGVYYFSGAAVAAVAVLILAGLILQGAGRLRREWTVEHYHDLGKLLFGFVVFWGYIAFSQYLLIWYGNLPEETVWYARRQSGPWGGVSLALLVGHLLIPFLGLLSRGSKRRPAVLGFWAAWMLAAHWLDLYWLVMPGVAHERLPLGVLDLCWLVGVGALYMAAVLRLVAAVPLLPQGDPRLGESLALENT